MMWFGLFIVTITVVGFLVAALGLKLAFNSDAELISHSCQLKEDDSSPTSACGACKIKNIADCNLKDNNQPLIQNNHSYETN